MILLDDVDVSCFQWFVVNNIKVDLSQSYLSPIALREFNRACEWLIQKKYKAPEGSSIWIPKLMGLGGMALNEETLENCQKVGFKPLF